MEHQNLWDVAKGILRRKCIDLCSYIRKETVWKPVIKVHISKIRKKKQI